MFNMPGCILSHPPMAIFINPPCQEAYRDRTAGNFSGPLLMMLMHGRHLFENPSETNRKQKQLDICYKTSQENIGETKKGHQKIGHSSSDGSTVTVKSLPSDMEFILHLVWDQACDLIDIFKYITFITTVIISNLLCWSSDRKQKSRRQSKIDINRRFCVAENNMSVVKTLVDDSFTTFKQLAAHEVK